MGRFLLIANYVCFMVNIVQIVFFMIAGIPALALLPALISVVNFAAIKKLSAISQNKENI
jgi:hypothetical protein